MIILKNSTFIDWKTLSFTKGHIVVEETVDSVRFVDSLQNINTNALIIDCQGKFVTKSFGNAHHHAYTALATGMPSLQKIPCNFYEMQKYFWWTLDKSLDLEMIKVCAYATAIACAKNGVTFVIDHNSSPFAIKGSLQTIADAFNEVGISHLLCYEISDRDGVDISRQGLAETESYLKSNQGLVGLHASFTLTNKTLEKAVNLSKKYNSGIHVHVAEDLYDQEHCYDIHNKRVVERFKEAGVLEMPKSLLVNCLYLTDEERHIIKDKGIHVVQNIESNLSNNAGQFSSCSINEHILLGTDGLHSDMLRSAKATYLNSQLNDTVDSAEIYRRFRNIHTYTKNNNFIGDGENNLVVLDYDPHTYFSGDNFLGHFLNGIDASQVQHVISNGRLIVKDHEIITVNETKINEKARELSKHLWEKMHELTV